MKDTSQLKNYKSKHVQMKYLNHAKKNKIHKVKNSILELEKNIREFKDRERKTRKTFKELKAKK